jgi:hypothetical protein
MSLLGDAYRRHLVLKTLASEESAKAFADPSTPRHIELGIVELGDDYSTAKRKLEIFYEELGRRIDEVGFLDQFVAFETLLNHHRKRIGRRHGRRMPAAKNLAQYLRSIDRDLADSYELLKFERDEVAHGLLPIRPLVATVIEEKRILKSVLAAL